MKKHYTEKDFIIMERGELGEYGYCKKCTCDMQRFKSDGILRHYKSHSSYKRMTTIHYN